MHRMHILNSKEVKEIKHQIIAQWGAFPPLEVAFLKSAKNKLYIVNRDIERLPQKGLRIDTLGMYFGEIFDSGNIRLSVEGAQMVGKVATKGILTLTDEQLDMWLKGRDVDTGDVQLLGFFILKHRNDIVGCGHCKNGKISNYMPKNRRIKELNPTFDGEEDADIDAENT